MNRINLHLKYLNISQYKKCNTFFYFRRLKEKNCHETYQNLIYIILKSYRKDYKKYFQTKFSHGTLNEYEFNKTNTILQRFQIIQLK